MGRSQVYWECYDVRACEAYSDGIPSVIQNWADKVPPDELRTDIHYSRSTIGRPDWGNILRDYTSRKLTKPEDKLVAISGVVKIIQARTGDEYFAGLWRKDFVTQLLWEKSFQQHTSLVSAKEYRAPSWSWASVDGSIDGGVSISEEGEILATILDVNVQVASNDPTGRVTSGRIRLSGPMITLQLQLKSTGNIEDRYSEYWLTIPGAEKETITRVSRSSSAPPNDLHCLIISRGRKGRTASGYDCLLLTPTKARRGVFHRWGTIVLGSYHSEGFDDWLEYEDSDGRGNFTISII